MNGTAAISVSKSFDVLEHVRAFLRPVIKSHVYISRQSLDLMLCGFSSNMNTLAHAQVTNEILAFIGVDLDEEICLLSKEQLEHWQIGVDEALQLAVNNLAALGVWSFGSLDGLYVSGLQDGYDAARLLLIQRERDGADGQNVYLAPDRDLLLRARADQEQSLLQMARLALPAIERGRCPLSPRPVQLDARGRWHEYTPPPTLAREFGLLQRRFTQRAYTDQEQPLKRWLRREHDHTCVSPVNLSENGEGHCVLSTLWPRSSAALLPVVDMVSFYDQHVNRMRRARWADIARAVSHHLQPTDWLPERVRTVGFPSEEEFQAMGAWTA